MEILKRSAIAVSQELSSKEEATKLAGRLLKDSGSIKEEYIDSMLDKLAKRNIIHRNKAANLKSKLAKHMNSIK